MKLSEVGIGAPGGLTPPVERLISTARKNEELGFDSLWWPDHIMGWHPDSIWTPDLADIARYQKNPHVNFDALLAMAVAAVSTSRVSLGTAVTDAIRRPPAVLAQAFLTLDHISQGRTILGLGAGEAENIVPYGLDYRYQASKMEEAIKIIRLLWQSDGPVDYEGRFWRLRGAVLGLGPYEEGKYPPIWVGAHGPRMLEIAGQLADGWFPAGLAAAEYGERLAVIRRIAAQHGRDPEAITPAFWAYLVIDHSHEACHQLLDTPLIKAYCLVRPAAAFERLGYQHPLGQDFYGIRDYIPTRYSRPEALAAIGQIPRAVAEEYILHGTPEDIAAQIAQYAAQGMRHILLWNITFLGDAGKVGSSFRLMAEVVKYIKGLA